MRDLPSFWSFLSPTRSLVMRAKTLRPARAWTERTAGLATRPVPTRALDMVRAIFERACVGRVCGSMRRRRMDVSQENVPKKRGTVPAVFPVFVNFFLFSYGQLE